MRVLIYSKGNKKDFIDLINFFEKERLVFVDFFDDLEEANYCSEIRKYDKFIIETENNIRPFVNLFRGIKDENSEAEILFFGEKIIDSTNLKFYLNNYSFFEKKGDIIKQMRDELKEEIVYKDIKINIENNEKKLIKIIKNGKEKEIKISTEIDFFLLTYFLRHYDEKINIDRLIDAISKEPELTKSSIAETSISSIRKLFKKELDINPIKAFKKVGYQFSY